MMSTKQVKIKFNRISYSQNDMEVRQNTWGIRQEGVEIIKMIQQGKEENSFSGSRTVNFSEQKMKEAYRKINKMLGGN